MGVLQGFHHRAESKITITTIKIAEGCHGGPLLTKSIALLGVDIGFYMKWPKDYA